MLPCPARPRTREAEKCTPVANFGVIIWPYKQDFTNSKSVSARGGNNSLIWAQRSSSCRDLSTGKPWITNPLFSNRHRVWWVGTDFVSGEGRRTTSLCTTSFFAFLAGGFLPLTHLLFDDLPPTDLLPTVGNKFLNCAATAGLSTFLMLVLFIFTVWLDDRVLVDSIPDSRGLWSNIRCSIGCTLLSLKFCSTVTILPDERYLITLLESLRFFPS